MVTHFALTMTTLDLGLTPTGTAARVPANVTTEYANTLADVPVVTSQAGARRGDRPGGRVGRPPPGEQN